MGFLGVASDGESVRKCVNSTRFEKLAGAGKGERKTLPPSTGKGVAGDWKNVFTERDKRIFKEEAGELLIRLGYEVDGDW